MEMIGGVGIYKRKGRENLLRVLHVYFTCKESEVVKDVLKNVVKDGVNDVVPDVVMKQYIGKDETVNVRNDDDLIDDDLIDDDVDDDVNDGEMLDLDIV
uniref:Uncharacterized protein n=1 Tax=Tanacetum cinerariifolium TaxID=118510 RepID=A0A6L2P1A2_TANCI|nr:hypothetical protein [Tanacetum cinerariifolium]